MGGVGDEGVSGTGASPTGDVAASSILTGARYDLRDTGSLQWTDAELLEYLNRAIRQLDNALSANASDWVWSESLASTLEEDENHVLLPGFCIVVREIWISSDQLYKKTPQFVAYRRQFNSSGKPVYWAHAGAYLNFDRAADQDYSLEIYFDQRSQVLESDDMMPYRDEFNDALRQMVVYCAKNRQEYSADVDAHIFNFFMSSAGNNVIRRTHEPKRYRLDY